MFWYNPDTFGDSKLSISTADTSADFHAVPVIGLMLDIPGGWRGTQLQCDKRIPFVFSDYLFPPTTNMLQEIRKMLAFPIGYPCLLLVNTTSYVVSIVFNLWKAAEKNKISGLLCIKNGD